MKQREIKFRAWLPNQGIMFYLPSYYLDLRIGKWEIDWNHIMQYTGLKDKNGKDIWEGDILFWGKNGPMEVCWSENWNCWRFKNYRNDKKEARENKNEYMTPDPRQTNTTFMEIVGNIYENPKLLK